MTDEAKAARNAYKREWYAANKDKAKAQQERHWQKVAAQQGEARARADERFYSPELVPQEFKRIVAEKRKAGELPAGKLSRDQVCTILRQILDNGMTRPPYTSE